MINRSAVRLGPGILAALLFAAPSFADPIVLGETARIHSEILNEDRALRIYLPPRYELSSERYPVLFLPDAETRFLHTAATAATLAQAGHVPQMIVVALDNTNRTRDLTPQWLGEVPEEHPLAKAAPQGGGGDEFLRFLREELVPWVDRSYRTVPFRILVGHSFGGLLAVHSFLTHPADFDAVVAISPTLAWDGEAELRRAEGLFASTPSLRGRLFLTVGNEGDPMHTAFEHFRDLLRTRAPEGLRWHAEVLPDQDHGSVPIPSVDRGLEWIYAKWRLPPSTRQAGLDLVDAHFAALSREYGYPVHPPEALVNALGYQALGAGDTQKAIEILQRNVRDFPASPNVYDSLGEAVEAAGQLERARDLYRRAWVMGKEADDPNAAAYEAHVDRVVAKLEK